MPKLVNSKTGVVVNVRDGKDLGPDWVPEKKPTKQSK